MSFSLINSILHNNLITEKRRLQGDIWTDDECALFMRNGAMENPSYFILFPCELININDSLERNLTTKNLYLINFVITDCNSKYLRCQADNVALSDIYSKLPS